MKVRLVAYRPNQIGTTADTTYELDLQESPNIGLNFQFADVKEPEKRKSNYSQTFKLPFTDKNNRFFQDWYNVNLETLVFSTRKKFEAILYSGSTPQFEGTLQLKSVLKKAKLYEVTLLSTTATLFSVIGESKLQDVYKDSSGGFSEELNHQLIHTDYQNNTFYKSWTATLQNTDGDTISDTSLTPNISKVIYPMSVTQKHFYFDQNVNEYMNMDQTDSDNLVNSIGMTAASEKTVPFAQFRPAIQVKELLTKIILKAGYSYTSSFIDSEYFGRLFTTSCNHLELDALPTTDRNVNPSGFFEVQNFNQWGQEYIPSSGGVYIQEKIPAENDTPATGCTIPNDPDDCWETSGTFEDCLTRIDPQLKEVTIRFRVDFENLFCNSGGQSQINLRISSYGVYSNGDTNFNDWGWDTNFTVYMTQVGPINGSAQLCSVTVPVFWFPVGSKMRFYVESASLIGRKSSSNSAMFKLGAYSADVGCGTAMSNIRGNWVGYSIDNAYGGIIDIPACIDPTITQAGFLKDILQRFNLIISTSAEDETNLIIEPYKDFVNGGEIKNWSNKVNTQKEIKITDTTSLQKKETIFTDLEDKDLYNKSIKEREPDINVYGHIELTSPSEFAKGKLTNKSIFSPFINSMVFSNDQEEFETYLPNMTVQYERSYNMTQDGVAEYKMTATKPKLFYYCGTPVDVLGVDNDPLDDGFYFHRTYYSPPPIGDGMEIKAMQFKHYPICSPFDIDPGAGVNTYTITQDNTSLYWNASPPLFGNLTVFNYNGNYGNWFNGSLYGKYWKPYLDTLYSPQARVMECYMNLNVSDIFNFKFSDDIYINDTYWKILKISNYQVDGSASTKVTFIKSIDSFETCIDCDFVVGSVDGVNLYSSFYYMWCPADDPNCVPIVSGTAIGVFVTPDCCECNGGTPQYAFSNYANQGMYPCMANTGSLPITLKSIFGNRSILHTNGVKGLTEGIFIGLNNPLVRGVNTTKYSQNLIPKYGNDIVISHNTDPRNIPQLIGESHRIVLTGFTDGDSRGYAYHQGNQKSIPFELPHSTNTIIRVKGISTVVSSTDSNYPIGSTEAFSYYTAFRLGGDSALGTLTHQLGTQGGDQEFSIKEGALPTMCTLYIDLYQDRILRFGLDDANRNTKRIWELSIDLDINSIKNMNFEWDANYALFQNGDIIKFENGNYMLWN